MSINNTTDDFFDLTGHTLLNSSFLRMFNILDDDGIKFLNIFRSYAINDSVKNDIVFYDTYEIDNKDFWENIADKVHDNINLWWVVCLINNVINPFEELEDGKNIKILRNYYISYLMREMRDMADL